MLGQLPAKGNRRVSAEGLFLLLLARMREAGCAAIVSAKVARWVSRGRARSRARSCKRAASCRR